MGAESDGIRYPGLKSMEVGGLIIVYLFLFPTQSRKYRRAKLGAGIEGRDFRKMR